MNRLDRLDSLSFPIYAPDSQSGFARLQSVDTRPNLKAIQDQQDQQDKARCQRRQRSYHEFRVGSASGAVAGVLTIAGTETVISLEAGTPQYFQAIKDPWHEAQRSQSYSDGGFYAGIIDGSPVIGGLILVLLAGAAGCLTSKISRFFTKSADQAL